MFEYFDKIIQQAELYNPGDDLVGQPVPACWPVTDKSGAIARLRFHMARQKKRFLADKSATFLKVIDISDDQTEDEASIVALARWHYYPYVYAYMQEAVWEVEESARPEPEYQASFNKAMHDYILTERDKCREDWMGTGKPAWILMHLVTRELQRGKGAGGLLTQ